MSEPSLFEAILKVMPNACCNEASRRACPYDLADADLLATAVRRWLESTLDSSEPRIARAFLEPHSVRRPHAGEVMAQHKVRAVIETLMALTTTPPKELDMTERQAQDETTEGAV